MIDIFDIANINRLIGIIRSKPEVRSARLEKHKQKPKKPKKVK